VTVLKYCKFRNYLIIIIIIIEFFKYAYHFELDAISDTEWHLSIMMRVYDASTPTELSTTAGDGALSTLFSVGTTGDVADAAIGNVINAAVNVYT